MHIGVSEIAAAVQRVRTAFVAHADMLNAADGRLGDGDTGTMLARLTERFATVDLSGTPDLGEAFMKLATAGAASTGSSLGTLVLTGLITASKATRGMTDIAPPDLPRLLVSVRDAMLVRGGAALGDKTVIDGVAAVAGGGTARGALEAFRDKPSRAGRARVYGEKSRGLDDPGMLAFDILCDALAAKEAT
jgi:hypothetical protein